MTLKIFLLAVLVISLSHTSYQQQYDCTFINGQGCMNGICKFCAMCVPSSCILATPYSTGNNEGSTCAATHQIGYEFYNYCISSGSDYDGDQCDTSTQCYPYRQSNTTSAHSWDNLTCNMDTCLLINIDGSQPAAPIPLDNTTIVLPTTNSSDTHHPTNKDTNRHHNSPFDLKSGSAISIALTSVCIIVSLCLVAWLIRILFYKTTYWPVINKFLCCGRCAYKSSDGSSNRSSTSTTRSPPPSFHSTGLVMRSNSNNSSHGSVLPNYFQQDPSPPKYEHAIVTQIRGMRFLNHSSLDNDNNENSASEHQPIWVPAQQPVWMPVYISPPRQNTSNSNSFAAFISGNNSQDWATETIRHQPSPSTEEEEETDLVDSHRR